jgi:pimeloyl-ACP methyl ester carboxylesterase
MFSGLLPVDDTALFVEDTGGDGVPLLVLNGAYADLKHWRPVTNDLGSGHWRHLRFDERARGRSRTSDDYSFEACLDDVDAVLEARGVQRPIVVGWSYGATLAIAWADRHPERVRGVVAVDGAMPYDWIDDAARERLRALFHRLRWILPVARRFGMAARMSAEEHAEVNIEVNEKLGSLGPMLERIECPVRYVVATGGHLGTDDEEMAEVRASLDPVLARNPHVRVSATTASNHGKILRKDFRAVSQAVREVAAATTPGPASAPEAEARSPWQG